MDSTLSVPLGLFPMSCAGVTSVAGVAAAACETVQWEGMEPEPTRALSGNMHELTDES